MAQIGIVQIVESAEFKEGLVAKDVEKSYASAWELAKASDENFLELGNVLSDLNESDIVRFRHFYQNSGISRRKAYYLIKVVRTFRDLKIPQKLLKELGFTKIKVIAPHVTKNNVHDLLAFAKTHTAKEIEAYVKGGKPGDNSHSVLMYFNEQNYEQLVDALVEHGAVRKGRGLDGKEEALMRLLETLKK